MPLNPLTPSSLPCRRRLHLACLAWLAAAAWASTPAQAAPLLQPSRDEEIVERLPLRLADAAAARAERQQRRLLLANPQQLPLALAQARAAIERSRRFGDPRELGQAQAALAPWWAQPAPPPPVQLLRAIILQSQHAFELALADLNALRAAGPQLPLGLLAQAELTRASLLQVQGRWTEAEQACEALAGPAFAALGEAVKRPADVCVAELMSLRGAEPQAEQRLQRLAREAAGSPDAAWVALVRAERAARRGEAGAGALFRAALAGRDDAYTLAAYADWLLAQGQPRQVLPLLEGRADADALLLRLAIAWRQLGDPRAEAASQQLAERFASALRRGDASHAREQALHALHLKQDAAGALALAQRNWQAQKEPADALLLVQAARAAGRPEAAEPVRRFAAERGWQDRRWAAHLAPPASRSTLARSDVPQPLRSPT